MRARLVEADVAVPPDAEQLEVKPAQRIDFLFIAQAEIAHQLQRQRAVGQVVAALGNVHVVEKLLLHEPQVALQGIGLHGVVFVQVEGDHVLEAEPRILVHGYQRAIHFFGRRASGKAQHRRFAFLLFLPDQGGYFLGYGQGCIVGIGVDGGRDTFVTELLHKSGSDRWAVRCNQGVKLLIRERTAAKKDAKTENRWGCRGGFVVFQRYYSGNPLAWEQTSQRVAAAQKP